MAIHKAPDLRGPVWRMSVIKGCMLFQARINRFAAVPFSSAARRRRPGSLWRLIPKRVQWCARQIRPTPLKTGILRPATPLGGRRWSRSSLNWLPPCLILGVNSRRCFGSRGWSSRSGGKMNARRTGESGNATGSSETRTASPTPAGAPGAAILDRDVAVPLLRVPGSGEKEVLTFPLLPLHFAKDFWG